jgi:hypothetical protein
MDERSDTPSVADLAGQAGALAVGLTTVTIQIFPFALPALILVIGPLTVLALAGLLLAVPILVPLWLGRRALRALRSRSKSEPVDHRGGSTPVRLPVQRQGSRVRTHSS